MDADLTIKKPKNISLEQAATLGVGTYVSFHIHLPRKAGSKILPQQAREWSHHDVLESSLKDGENLLSSLHTLSFFEIRLSSNAMISCRRLVWDCSGPDLVFR